MRTKQLVLYSAANDPVALAASNHAGFSIIHIDELEGSIKCADWPNILAIDFAEEVLQRFDGAVVHNRVFSLEDTHLGQMLTEWGYQEQWAQLALRPLYRLAAALVHDVGVRGVSRSLLPLTTQWWAMRERGIEALPQYIYAFGASEPDLSQLKDPMRKSIWSLHAWKQERHFGFTESHWHPFYVERPTGTPVVCSFMGDDLDFVFLKERVSVSTQTYRRLATAASETFESLAGEFLTYVEEDGTVRFYAFSPLLTASATDAAFIDRLARLPNSLRSDLVRAA